MDNYENDYQQNDSDQAERSQMPGHDQRQPGSERPPYYNQYQAPPPPQQNTQALVSMIVGIFALVGSCCCLPVGFVMGITSILLAALSKRGNPFSGYAVAGLILGIISLLISLAVGAYFVLVYWMTNDPTYGPILNDIIRQYYESVPAQ